MPTRRAGRTTAPRARRWPTSRLSLKKRLDAHVKADRLLEKRHLTPTELGPAIRQHNEARSSRTEQRQAAEEILRVCDYIRDAARTGAVEASAADLFQEAVRGYLEATGATSPRRKGEAHSRMQEAIDSMRATFNLPP